MSPGHSYSIDCKRCPPFKAIYPMKGVQACLWLDKYTSLVDNSLQIREEKAIGLNETFFYVYDPK